MLNSPTSSLLTSQRAAPSTRLQRAVALTALASALVACGDATTPADASSDAGPMTVVRSDPRLWERLRRALEG